jgi:hypothetical protein
MVEGKPLHCLVSVQLLGVQVLFSEWMRYQFFL